MARIKRRYTECGSLIRHTDGTATFACEICRVHIGASNWRRGQRIAAAHASKHQRGR